MALKAIKLSASAKKQSKWIATPIKQEELVSLKKDGVDGQVLKLVGLPGLDIEIGQVDLLKAHWVSGEAKNGQKREFLSLADFGGRGVIETSDAIEIAGKQYRVDIGLKLSLSPVAK